MGLRELLILILILAIVAVGLRGLYVTLSSRRGRIKIALDKNIPEYDLNELEMRELPNGGARMVERSFAEVLRQNSEHAARAHATATGKPSTLRPRAKGLKTNLSRSAMRSAPVAAAAASQAPAVKSEPAPESHEPELAAERDAAPEASRADAIQPSYDDVAEARAAQNFERDFEQGHDPELGQDFDGDLESDLEKDLDQAFARELDQELEQGLDQGLEQELEQELDQELDRELEQQRESDAERSLEQDLDQALTQESHPAEEAELSAGQSAYQAEYTRSDIEEVFIDEGFSVDGPVSSVDGPVPAEDAIDAEQGSTEQPRYEDQDDPATYERALAEEEGILFDEEPLINLGDGNFHEEMLSESEEAEPQSDTDWNEEKDADEHETDEPVFSAIAEDRDDFDDFGDDVNDDDINDDDTDGDDMDEVIEEEELTTSRRPREDEELDDVLDELLQPSPAAPIYTAAPVPEYEPENEPDYQPDYQSEYQPEHEPEYQPEYEPDPEPEPEYEPEPEPAPEYEPPHQPDTDPEPQPTYDPEPPPHHDPQPEPATRFEDDPLLDYSADDLEEGDTRITGQTTAQPEDFIDPLEDAELEPEPEPESEFEPETEAEPENTYEDPQENSQSGPHVVEDDMPNFDNEYIADPEPQPSENDSFGASRDDEMDVLFDDDDRERRIAALEEQQDSASKRFMSWAGGAFSRLGAGVAAGKARAAEEAAERNEKKARKKQAQIEQRRAQKEADDLAEAQREADFADDYFDDEDSVSPAREQERPGAAERRRAEQLQQSQLDLEMDSADEDDAYEEEYARDEEQAGNQEPPAYSEVLVINVMARPGTDITGEELLPVLMGSGLRFGEMSIFHHHAERPGGPRNGPVMFSVANALNPGTFDLNKISEFSTQGVCFFMTLPNVVNNMIAFEQMLATARHVQAALDAELKDDNRSVMTAQTVEHYRQRIRDFELQELKNAHAR